MTYQVANDAGEVVLTSFRGKRFRLSYLLATDYSLPLTLGHAVSLSSILKSGTAEPTLFDRVGE